MEGWRPETPQGSGSELGGGPFQREPAGRAHRGRVEGRRVQEMAEELELLKQTLLM